jgi:hypothetical protein
MGLDRLIASEPLPSVGCESASVRSCDAESQGSESLEEEYDEHVFDAQLLSQPLPPVYDELDRDDESESNSDRASDEECDSASEEEYDEHAFDSCLLNQPLPPRDSDSDSYDSESSASSGSSDDRSESSSAYEDESESSYSSRSLVSSEGIAHMHEFDGILLGVEYYTDSDDEGPTYRESDEASEAYGSDYGDESDGPTYDVSTSYDY